MRVTSPLNPFPWRSDPQRSPAGARWRSTQATPSTRGDLSVGLREDDAQGAVGVRHASALIRCAAIARVPMMAYTSAFDAYRVAPAVRSSQRPAVEEVMVAGRLEAGEANGHGDLRPWRISCIRMWNSNLRADIGHAVADLEVRICRRHLIELAHVCSSRA